MRGGLNMFFGGPKFPPSLRVFMLLSWGGGSIGYDHP